MYATHQAVPESLIRRSAQIGQRERCSAESNNHITRCSEYNTRKYIARSKAGTQPPPQTALQGCGTVQVYSPHFATGLCLLVPPITTLHQSPKIFEQIQFPSAYV